MRLIFVNKMKDLSKLITHFENNYIHFIFSISDHTVNILQIHNMSRNI